MIDELAAYKPLLRGVGVLIYLYNEKGGDVLCAERIGMMEDY